MSWRTDPQARELADRHYNRQSVGAPNFAPPGRCLVLKAETATGRAFWITSWPYARYVRHRWAGAWMCSAFRNEGAAFASDLIRDAIAATRAYYGEPPLLGLVTFLNESKVKPIIVRGRKTYGRTLEKAGFERVGRTGSGLLAFRLRLARMAAAEPPSGFGGPHADHRSAAVAMRDYALEALVMA